MYSGLWAERPAESNFYQRNGGLFDRVERFLGPIIPEENLLAAHDSGRVFSVEGNYGLNFFTRDVMPDRTMVKLGPLMIDFLGISTSVLFTSYNGDAPLNNGVESSGWIAMIGLPVRASLRLTDTIYFQLSGMIYWLPLENDFGVANGLGANWNTGLNGRLNHEFQWRGILFRMYDYLSSTGNFVDLIEPWAVNEIDEVGRYRFGSPHIDSGTAGRGIYWNPRYGGVSNVAGLEMQRQASGDWWIYGNLSHTDFWGASSLNLDDNAHMEQLLAEWRYVGSDYRFAPLLYYQLTSPDYFQTMTHIVGARFTGRLTEYLAGWASVGYLLQTGKLDANNDSILWELGFRHDLTEYTSHSISGGQTYAISPSLDESVGSYLRYTIEQAFGPRLVAGAHAQWFDGRTITRGAVIQNETYQGGVNARYAIAPDTSLVLGSTYAISHPAGNAVDMETWLHYLTLQRPLWGRLNASTTYQYIEQTGPIGSNFSEHMLLLSMQFSF
jgi:hypothetical protein